MKQVIPWLVGIAALVAMYLGWVAMDRQIDQNAEDLATRYERMSDEEMLEDLLRRQSEFSEGLGAKGASDELDDMTIEAGDAQMRARARERKGERRRKAEAQEAAIAEEESTNTMIVLWVALIGLIAMVVGGGIGAVLMLRKPNEDEGMPV